MSVEVTTPKLNNYLESKTTIYQMKYLIVFEAFIGINRLYLCGYRKCVLWLSYTYDVLLLLVTATLLICENYFKTFYFSINVIIVEYFLLAFGALFMRKALRKFFSSLQSFDEKLNIGDDASLLSPKSWSLYGVGAILLYNLTEIAFFIVFVIFLTDLSFNGLFLYLPIIVHDVEMIFYCYLLASIFSRLALVKAHVAKVFNMNIKNRPDSKDSETIRKLVKRVNLDISSVHDLYDLLHKCSRRLNCLMSLSMIAMIITSGLSTISVLKHTITMLQNIETYPHPEAVQSIAIFSITRSLKLTLLLILPCFITNKTKSEVSIIREIIYDALNRNYSYQDKIERRKIKTFFLLVCENEFVYSFLGVINLDMSLPLSYTSLCTTYLIIVVQCSKFLD